MNIQQLIRFYLSCIEAEDRQALCKKLTALHHSVLSPWDDKEVLFSRGEACVEFETQDDREQRLLSGRVAAAGEADRFYQRSLYNLAEQVAAARGQPVGFLAEHYRSHPDIVEFSNRTFYSGRLVLRTRIEAVKFL